MITLVSRIKMAVRKRQNLLDHGHLLHGVNKTGIGQMHRIHLAFDVSLNLDADGTDQTVEVRAVAKLDGLANHIGLKALEEA